jgi:hypothetical protein
MDVSACAWERRLARDTGNAQVEECNRDICDSFGRRRRFFS